MAIADAHGLPIALWTGAANTHEVKLVGETLEMLHVDEKPLKLIGDKAYDSDELRKELGCQQIELIAPHRSNRKKKKTQDGRKLRRYRKRWKVERLFAWLHNFRRCVVRYDYHAMNFEGFLLLTCVMIYLRKYF